jgi:hypothetical protein
LCYNLKIKIKSKIMENEELPKPQMPESQAQPQLIQPLLAEPAGLLPQPEVQPTLQAAPVTTTEAAGLAAAPTPVPTPTEPQSIPYRVDTQPAPDRDLPAAATETPSVIQAAAQAAPSQVAPQPVAPQVVSQAVQEQVANEIPEAAKKSGTTKWIIAAVSLMVVVGAAAGLYSSGIFNQTQIQHGAAEDTLPPLQNEPLQSSTETGVTATTEQTPANQLVPGACPRGQVMDPASSACACDTDNNYFELNIPGAYAQPSAGQPQLSCTTCPELSSQILTLGQSSDPADAVKKSALETVAQQNNCSPCQVFDDEISLAQQNKAWDDYFNDAVAKAQDSTCGRSLPKCDSLKWQLLFLNGTMLQAAKTPGTSLDVLQKLKDVQQNLEQELGTDPACYDIQQLCTDLKGVYGIGALPQGGQPSPAETQQLTGQTGTEQAASSQEAGSGLTQQDGTQVDFSTVLPGQLFNKNFYLLYCPVEAQPTQQSETTTQQSVAPLSSSPQTVSTPQPVETQAATQQQGVARKVKRVQ